MMISRRVELTELLEAFVLKHGRPSQRGFGEPSVTLLDAAEVPLIAGGGRSLARPAELFLEALRRHDFRLIDDYLPEDHNGR